MNKLLLVVVWGVLVGGCAAVPKQSTLTPLNLTAHKEAVDDYWITYRKVAPVYPQQAKNDKISGCVEFSLLIDVNGRAVEPTIIKAFPEGVFDEQAAIAIRKWLWVPTKTNTERQPVLTTIQHDFVVRNSQNAKAAYDACKI